MKETSNGPTNDDEDIGSTQGTDTALQGDDDSERTVKVIALSQSRFNRNKKIRVLREYTDYAQWAVILFN